MSTAEMINHELAALWEMCCEAVGIDTDATAAEWREVYEAKRAQVQREAAEPHLRKKWAEEEAAKLAKTTVGLAAILDRFLENAEWESSGEEMAQKIIESVQTGLLKGAGE